MIQPTKNSTPAEEIEDLLAAYTKACIKYGQAATAYESGGYFAGYGTESEAMRDARKECENLRQQIKDVASVYMNEGKETPNAA